MNTKDLLFSEIMMITMMLSIMTKKKNRKRFGALPILRNRSNFGYYNNLIAEMRLSDKDSFENFHRMTPELFDQLLSMVGPLIKKQKTTINPITAGQRLSLTLRYLASGDSMISIGKYGYRVGASTTSNIIQETTAAIWNVLRLKVFPSYKQETWENIVANYYSKWNFPNCLGAIDGKHVVAQAFPHSNSKTFNYKHSHSIVLMAICDAEYKFIFVDIGASGSQNDSTIFRRSKFGDLIINDPTKLKIPINKILPGFISLPHVFVADEAFPLLTNIMRPYPGSRDEPLDRKKLIFNYRLSRARRVIENTFGILAAKWRIYRKPIISTRKTAENIVKSTVCLHNWLKINSNNNYQYFSNRFVDRFDSQGNVTDGQWREDWNDNNALRTVGQISSNNSTDNAKMIQDHFAHYLTDVNILPWQNEY